eukprot:6287619-Alexandrium_andersonii.AAC.1
MSASLVGSEMCIRDSENTIEKRRAQKMLNPRQTAPIPDQGTLVNRLRTCLLYTSDAADDM